MRNVQDDMEVTIYLLYVDRPEYLYYFNEPLIKFKDLYFVGWSTDFKILESYIIQRKNAPSPCDVCMDDINFSVFNFKIIVDKNNVDSQSQIGDQVCDRILFATMSREKDVNSWYNLYYSNIYDYLLDSKVTYDGRFYVVTTTAEYEAFYEVEDLAYSIGAWVEDVYAQVLTYKIYLEKFSYLNKSVIAIDKFPVKRIISLMGYALYSYAEDADTFGEDFYSGILYGTIDEVMFFILVSILENDTSRTLNNFVYSNL